MSEGMLGRKKERSRQWQPQSREMKVFFAFSLLKKVFYFQPMEKKNVGL